jgi:hypothetical protein
MHVTDEKKAAEQYRSEVAANPERMVDGYGEAPEETAGIGGVRRVVKMGLIGILLFALGGSVVGFYNWQTTRSNPAVQTLTEHQYELFMAAADKNSRGFNDGAIGALTGANEYEPVAIRTDSNLGQRHVVMAKCLHRDRATCARELSQDSNPVIYIGLTDEVTQDATTVRFSPVDVFIDLPRYDRVLRCAVHGGDKVLVGEAGPTTFNLPRTVQLLDGFAGDREFTNESPDGDLSFWDCTFRKRG